MGTLVCFFAHPDDESVVCGGTMAAAAAAGNRVVLVTATRGERGEVAAGALALDEQLGERRANEVAEAARLLGVQRLELLGYVDSGVAGSPANHAAGSFWTADVEQAAGRLGTILREEEADVLVVPDETGTTGHPDHVKAHQVGVRASALAGTPALYEVTINRDHMRSLAARAAEMGLPAAPEGIDFDTLGTPEARITTTVDVRPHLSAKRAAIAAHASQFPGTSFFLSLPHAAFAELWGREWFIRRRPPAAVDDGVLEGLDPTTPGWAWRPRSTPPAGPA